MAKKYKAERRIANISKSGFTIVELLIVVVVIAILAAITIVAYNGITQTAKEAARAAEIASWKKKSEVYKTLNNIECPAGYVFVYGNNILGTNDFCVMKYEAKNDGSGQAVSTANGTPWVNITQTDAITAAATTGGHLITEAEWMTIAADVLSVKYNWSGEDVGNGIIFQGHVKDNPSTALAASSDDANALNGMTAGIGTLSGSNSSRVLYLSSGDAIWDLSGNVYEWTQQAVGAPTLASNQIGVPGDTGFNWREWTHESLTLGNLAAVSRPSTLAPYINPITGGSLSDIASWDASKGIGRIYAHYADTSSHAFFRGGHWGHGSTAGVLALPLDRPSSFSTSYLGFRVTK